MILQILWMINLYGGAETILWKYRQFESCSLCSYGIFTCYSFIYSLCYIDLKNPDGIAFDWLTGSLYWTDAQENTINRLPPNKTKEVLVHEELDMPRAIALNPCTGEYVHFSCWHRFALGLRFVWDLGADSFYKLKINLIGGGECATLGIVFGKQLPIYPLG